MQYNTILSLSGISFWWFGHIILVVRLQKFLDQYYHILIPKRSAYTYMTNQLVPITKSPSVSNHYY